MLDWHTCQICCPLEIKLLLLLLLMLYCKIIIAVLNIPNMCLESKKRVEVEKRARFSISTQVSERIFV